MKISVITATYNAGECLPGLIRSLQAQTYKKFEWVVADGGSTDETLDILKSTKDLNLTISSQSDFGIYDALNRAISMCSGEFYVVIGADDQFSPDAIENFHKQIDAEHSVFTCPIVINDKIYKLSPLPMFLSGFRSKICGHSIATLFRKSLHQKYGLYSKSYPIAADYDFMMKLVTNKEKIKFFRNVAGTFGTSGISTINRLGSATEVMRIMIAHGFSSPIQYLILGIRMAYRSIK